MDGVFGHRSASGSLDTQVIIVGTTSQPEQLDPAITRPGRLDRIVRLPLPDFNARKGLFSSVLFSSSLWPPACSLVTTTNNNDATTRGQEVFVVGMGRGVMSGVRVVSDIVPELNKQIFCFFSRLMWYSPNLIDSSLSKTRVFASERGKSSLG